MTLGITLALALALSGRLEWAGVAVGLAASAKYPGALAIVAVVAAGWGAGVASPLPAGAGRRGLRADEPLRRLPRGRRLGGR